MLFACSPVHQLCQAVEAVEAVERYVSWRSPSTAVASAGAVRRARPPKRRS